MKPSRGRSWRVERQDLAANGDGLGVGCGLQELEKMLSRRRGKTTKSSYGGVEQRRLERNYRHGITLRPRTFFSRCKAADGVGLGLFESDSEEGEGFSLNWDVMNRLKSVGRSVNGIFD